MPGAAVGLWASDFDISACCSQFSDPSSRIAKGSAPATATHHPHGMNHERDNNEPLA